MRFFSFISSCIETIQVKVFNKGTLKNHILIKYLLKDNILIYAFYNTYYTDPDFYGINSIKEVYSLLNEAIGPVCCSEFKILRNCKLL